MRIKRFCKFCGKELVQKRLKSGKERLGVFLNRHFCDKECKKEFTISQSPKCKWCGTRHLTKRHKKYCSMKCYSDARKNIYYGKECLYCGKKFYRGKKHSTNFKKQKFCSVSCSTKYYKGSK